MQSEVPRPTLHCNWELYVLIEEQKYHILKFIPAIKFDDVSYFWRILDTFKINAIARWVGSGLIKTFDTAIWAEQMFRGTRPEFVIVETITTGYEFKKTFLNE